MSGSTTRPPIGKLESVFGIPAAELAYAANAASVIGGIASVAGFFMQRSENRKIIGKLDEIQGYLREIDGKIEAIIEQNKEILARLDELPAKIRAIVDEVVAGHLLEERYSTLTAIRLNYFNLNAAERRRYRINTTGWDRFSEALTYMVTRENRLSKLIELLFWCEFALVVTEGRAVKVIRSLVLDKGSMIVPLFQQLRDDLRAAHNALLTTLSSQYVISHNLSDSLNDLDDLTFELAQDKPEGRDVFWLDCPDGQIPNGGCVERTGWRSYPENIAFNREKAKIPNRVNEQTAELKVRLEGYLAARDALLAILQYMDILSDDALEITSLHLSTEIVEGFEVVQDDVQFVPLAE